MGYIDIVNLITIGRSYVGKTVLIRRFVAEFSGQLWDPTTDGTQPTITNELTKLEVTVDKKLVELRFWDTAGQERFNSLSSSFYRNADGVLLCYDMTDLDSFIGLPFYVEQIKRYCNKDTVVTLLATKNDLICQRVISQKQGKDFADIHGFDFYEVSSYTNSNVANSVVFCMKKILDQVDKGYKLSQSKFNESQALGGDKNGRKKGNGKRGRHDDDGDINFVCPC
jgi:Ras-related protein Rab-1A